MALVLVAVEEPLFAKQIASILTDLGHEAVHASDGEVALALYAIRKPALVVASTAMRTVVGSAFVEDLRDQYPDARVSEIAARHERRPLKSGARSVPIDREELTAEIARSLR